MAKKTRQIRIITDGRFDKLMSKIKKQFKDRRGIDLRENEICEDIASAIDLKKIYD